LDERPPGEREPVPASRTVAKDIETRLLAYAHNLHGKSGKHETTLEPWADWAARVGAGAALPVADAKRALEAAVDRAGAARGDLPWVAAAA
ncbi:MAG TPA: hypothetical protein VGG33_18160, partial [Polyangia bacterium]